MEEYLKVAAESRGSPKKSESRSQRALKNNLLDSIARASKWGANVVVSHRNDDGTVRMKIVLKKQDLKKLMLMSMSSETGNLSNSSSLEQRLNLMRKRRLLIINRASHRSSWTPVLQSIPE